MGRLIRTQSPFPSTDNNLGLRSEHFFYDGIRRVQEVMVDPIVALVDADSTGDAAVINAANQAQNGSPQPLDGEAAPLGVEGAQAIAVQPTTTTYLDREYIWGPGDRGVDELLCQYDRSRNPWWTLQDDGGDVVALCDKDSTNGYRGRAVAQYTFDAYGQPATAVDLVANHPTLRCGHKALFIDRLDSGVADNYGNEQPRLVVLGSILCQNRNRSYSPSLGRFLQQDPNETGATELHGHYGGADADSFTVAFDLDRLYGDGSSRYQYIRSNPATSADALGLYSNEDLTEDMFKVAGLVNPFPTPADFITAMYRTLFEDYSENLMADVKWSSNWNRPDDDHSHMDGFWIALALGRGLYEAFDINIPFTDLTVNPLELFGKKTSGPHGAHMPRKANIRGGHTVHTKRGQSAHKAYKEMCAKVGIREPKWKFEKTVTGVGRLDGISAQTREIRELKPNTPSGRARGARQLARYLGELELKYKDPPGSWTGYLDVYDP